MRHRNWLWWAWWHAGTYHRHRWTGSHKGWLKRSTRIRNTVCQTQVVGHNYDERELERKPACAEARDNDKYCPNTFLSVLLRGVERLLAAAVSAVDVDGRLCSVTVVCDFGAASKCAEIIFQYEKTKKHRGMRKRQNTTKHQSDTPATMLIWLVLLLLWVYCKSSFNKKPSCR